MTTLPPTPGHLNTSLLPASPQGTLQSGFSEADRVAGPVFRFWKRRITLPPGLGTRSAGSPRGLRPFTFGFMLFRHKDTKQTMEKWEGSVGLFSHWENRDPEGECSGCHAGVLPKGGARPGSVLHATPAPGPKCVQM